MVRGSFYESKLQWWRSFSISLPVHRNTLLLPPPELASAAERAL